MAYQYMDFYIPDRMMDGIKRYIEVGIRPGDFLCAVISNDLKAAVSLADDENIRNLPAYIAYFYNNAPETCWGSPQNLLDWISRDD